MATEASTIQLWCTCALRCHVHCVEITLPCAQIASEWQQEDSDLAAPNQRARSGTVSHQCYPVGACQRDFGDKARVADTISLLCRAVCVSLPLQLHRAQSYCTACRQPSFSRASSGKARTHSGESLGHETAESGCAPLSLSHFRFHFWASLCAGTCWRCPWVGGFKRGTTSCCLA